MAIISAIALIAAAAAPIVWIGTRKPLELIPVTEEPGGKGA